MSVAVLLSACGDDSTPFDMLPEEDAGEVIKEDAGPPPTFPDRGAPTDRGFPEDEGFPDFDAGAFDTGVRDTGVRDTGVRDTGPIDVGVPDVGSPADVGPLPGEGPALPAWDAATVAHVREVRARGAAMGNRLSVFAKIGDSITESGSFLSDVGFGWGSVGAYSALSPAIQVFRSTALPSQDGQARNSFNRASVCATAGWTADDALAGGTSSPLRRELAALRPAWAIVMYGTNDIDRSTLERFRVNLDTIVDIAEAGGTVAVLSTIPDRNDGAGPAAAVLRFNDTIRAVTAARHLPLLDYWAALQALPSHGVSTDRIHPSVYVTGGSTEPAYFTSAGLQYGYNVRNLTAIQMLDRLRTLP
ncbi:MAG: SGNH/GDSL hydrolase family protein [Myxococcales bacterium]|nr:SGNH/GDSL hydrolase family protein [Myxococcales bacterium]